MSFKKLSKEDKDSFVLRCLERESDTLCWSSFKELSDSKTILIVGDKPGPRATDISSDHSGTPFIGQTHSGGYINSELVLAKIPEEPLMWCNSATQNSMPTDPLILKIRKWKHVVALGNNAAEWLIQNNISTFMKFHHPQYWFRFGKGEPYALIEFLKSVT
jgi:hypothetical protein